MFRLHVIPEIKRTWKCHVLLHFMWEKNMEFSMFRLHVMRKRNMEISMCSLRVMLKSASQQFSPKTVQDKKIENCQTLSQ